MHNVLIIIQTNHNNHKRQMCSNLTDVTINCEICGIDNYLIIAASIAPKFCRRISILLYLNRTLAIIQIIVCFRKRFVSTEKGEML